MDGANIISPYRWWHVLTLFVIWLISFVLVCSLIDNDFIQIGLCLCIFLGVSGWGHVLVYPIHYKKGRLLEGFIWGCISGIALGALIISIVVYISGWNFLVIFVSIVVLPALILIFLLKTIDVNFELFHTKKADPIILLFAMLIVTLFFYFPFKNLGALIDDKYIYAWLFGHDFINRGVHVVSLSQGLPLDSFHFSEETLSYYWLAYVYPALLHNNNWIKLDTHSLLQLTSLFYCLLTVASLVLFLNNFIYARKYLVMILFLALLCYSYNDLYIAFITVWREITGKQDVIIFGYNVSIFSGFSHTFYRFYLVQFQATLGLGIMLMIFSMYTTSQTQFCLCIIGLLLGLLFGVDATNGIMLTLWFACMAAFNLLVNKQERISNVIKYISSLSFIMLVYVVLFSIKMYSFQAGRGVLQVSPNWLSIIFSPFYFLLEFGPMFLFAIAGIVKLVRQKEKFTHWAYPYIILFAVGLFFTAFITNPAESQFGLLKATRIIPISLLVLTAYLWQQGFQNRKVGAICLFLLLIALPTFFTDILKASDISNPSSTYVRYSDMEAAKWIKTNLPIQSIIQAEPNYPGIQNQYKPKYSYSLIPVFAERRTAIGEWKLSSVEHPKTDMVGERYHSIKKMFSTIDIKECIRILKKYNIDYIYVGELEKKLYPEGVKKFYRDPNFDNIYNNQSVDIFRDKKK